MHAGHAAAGGATAKRTARPQGASRVTPTGSVTVPEESVLPAEAAATEPSPRWAGARVAVVGGGPAGLMAAEVLVSAGVGVDLYDAMPTVGRKFLLAGKGGLNLTHGEPVAAFPPRYGSRGAAAARWLDAFGPQDLRDWAEGLGVRTFVGSSGRVFPVDLKAAPLLRAWLQRLRQQGVRFHMRHRWLGWAAAPEAALRFAGPDGSERPVTADAVVLALGGASWPRLGSDGGWVPRLRERGIAVAPLLPSNCGFDVARPAPDGGLAAGWSALFRGRFAGHALKNVSMALPGLAPRQTGEFVITETGVEGGLVYALSGPARDAIAAHGRAVVSIDLLAAKSVEQVRAEVERPRGSRSMSTHLKSRLGLDGAKAGLLRELLPAETFADGARLAAAIKALPLPLVAPRPVAEAISSAGGVRLEALDDGLMCTRLPGVACAGEMLDWEAPTGGYLLTACFASGVVAARGVLAWLDTPGRDASRNLPTGASDEPRPMSPAV